MCEQQRRATVGERVSSRIKTLSGAKPCLFSGNVALGSPKWGLCFHGCGPRSGNPPSFLTLWWAQLCPRLAQHRLGFAHLAVISMVVSVFLLCLPSVCSVASYIQYLIHWLLCRTPFTRITFLNMAFSKAFLNMAFSKTLVYTHALV